MTLSINLFALCRKYPECQGLNEKVRCQGSQLVTMWVNSNMMSDYAFHDLGMFMLKINHVMTPDMKQNNHGLLSQRKSFIWTNLNIL